MERLTIKNSDGTHSQITETKFIQFFDKVAEFEDFMEEQGFESLEKLKNALLIKLPEERVKQIAMEEMRKELKNNIAQILKKEVPELYRYKDNWQKLKEWALYLCYFELVDKMEELEKENKCK